VAAGCSSTTISAAARDIESKIKYYYYIFRHVSFPSDPGHQVVGSSWVGTRERSIDDDDQHVRVRPPAAASASIFYSSSYMHAWCLPPGFRSSCTGRRHLQPPADVPLPTCLNLLLVSSFSICLSHVLLVRIYIQHACCCMHACRFDYNYLWSYIHLFICG
jgi:hypothetical protein